jgi:hypothetical protein
MSYTCGASGYAAKYFSADSCLITRKASGAAIHEILATSLGRLLSSGIGFSSAPDWRLCVGTLIRRVKLLARK